MFIAVSIYVDLCQGLALARVTVSLFDVGVPLALGQMLFVRAFRLLLMWFSRNVGFGLLSV